MGAEAFVAIKKLLEPYAKHFKTESEANEYSLHEDLPHSATLFAMVHISRGGARLVFYPLQVFPELASQLPVELASKIKSKCVLAFPEVTARDGKLLAKMFAAGHKRIAAQRMLAPDRGYYSKVDLEDTAALITKLVEKSKRAGVTVTARATGVVVTVPSTIPAALAARQKKPGTLVFKTITPAEHDALARLLR